MSESFREGMQVGNAFMQVGANVRGTMDKNKVVADKKLYDQQVNSNFKQLVQGREPDPATVKDPKALSEARGYADKQIKFNEERDKRIMMKTTQDVDSLVKAAGLKLQVGDKQGAMRAMLPVYDAVPDGVNVKKDENGNCLIKDGKFWTVDAHGEEEEHPFEFEYIYAVAKQNMLNEDGGLDPAKMQNTLLYALHSTKTANKELRKHAVKYTSKDGDDAYVFKQMDRVTGQPVTVRVDQTENEIPAEQWIEGGYTTKGERVATETASVKLKGDKLGNEKKRQDLLEEKYKVALDYFKQKEDTVYNADGTLNEEDTDTNSVQRALSALEHPEDKEAYGQALSVVKYREEIIGKAPEEKPNPVEMDAATVKAINGLTDARKKAFLETLSPEDRKKYDGLNAKETPGGGETPKKETDRKDMESVSDTERAKRTKAAKKANPLSKRQKDLLSYFCEKRATENKDLPREEVFKLGYADYLESQKKQEAQKGKLTKNAKAAVATIAKGAKAVRSVTAGLRDKMPKANLTGTKKTDWSDFL